MKRILSMLLVFIMLLTVLMAPAIAEGATEGEEDTGASITRTGDEEPEAVEPDDEAAEPDEEELKEAMEKVSAPADLKKTDE